MVNDVTHCYNKQCEGNREFDRRIYSEVRHEQENENCGDQTHLTLVKTKKKFVFSVLPVFYLTYRIGIIYFVVVFVESHHKFGNEYSNTRNNEISKSERTVTNAMI